MSFSRAAIWVVIFWCACWPVAHGQSKAPFHLVIITADDMNGDSSGWMGNKLKPTPNLDKFAATCHKFINCHVSAPICQPSRSALMTGRVPHRSGALGFHPINLDVPTLVELLKARGYYAAAINKFEHMAPPEKFPWDVKLGGSGKNPTLIAAQVRQSAKAAIEAKKPLFLNVNITDPHRAFPGSEQEVAQKQKKKKAIDGSTVKAFTPDEVTVPSFLEDIPAVRKEVAQYYTAIRRFDQSFGEIIAVLTELGILDNAVVVFISDHGMSFPFSKATVYRNGTWSPVLLRYPAMGRRVENRTDMLSSLDILPTVLEILGEPTPKGLDGQSWLPLVRGEPQPGRDHVITHVNTVSSGKSFPGRCVRTLNHSYLWHAWPDGKTKIRIEAMNGITFNALAEAAKSDPKIQARVRQFHDGVVHGFYDLQNDPDERVNRMTDAASRTEISRLQRILLSHMERTGDPQLENYKRSLGK